MHERALDEPTIEQRVDAAKRAVERAARAIPGDRRWLVGLTPPSYENPEYEVSVFVLEGSPPKGFVLVTWKRVIALDSGGDRIRGPWELV